MTIYYNRFLNGGRLAEGEMEKALALWSIVRTYRKIPPGDTQAAYRTKLERIHQAVTERAFSSKERTPEAGLLLCAAALLLFQILKQAPDTVRPEEDTLTPKERDTLASMFGRTIFRSKPPSSVTEGLFRLRECYQDLIAGPNQNLKKLAGTALVAGLFDRDDSPVSWEDRLRPCLGLEEISAATLARLHLKGDAFFQVSITAAAAGKSLLVSDMLKLYFQQFLDPATGNLETAVWDKGAWKPVRNLLGKPIFRYSPWLAALLALVCPRIDDVERASDGLDQMFTKKLQAAWNRLPVALRPVEPARAEVLAEIAVAEETYPGLIKKGRIYAFTFQALNYLCYHYTMPPAERPARLRDARPAVVLEEMLTTFFKSEAVGRKFPLAWVRPWPYGVDYCLTIRHDVDRLPDHGTFDRLVSWEERKGLGVSWYFIANRLDMGILERIKKAGHEIGLHAYKLGDKGQEARLIESAAAVSIKGECPHQGGGADEWFGPLQLDYAAQCGFRYVITQFNHTHPFLFLSLAENGEVRSHDEVWCLSFAGTVDKPGKSRESVYKSMAHDIAFLEKGYHTLISNHPDMNFEFLRDLEALLPIARRVNWTAEQTIDWWRKTHDRRWLSLNLRRVEPEAVVFAIHLGAENRGFRLDFFGLPAETWKPVATPGLQILDLAPVEGGVSVHLSAPEGRHELTFHAGL
ncbi:MAG: hypothetical protein AB1896_07475 [Thermodesulfobacteriota bacterium]